MIVCVSCKQDKPETEFYKIKRRDKYSLAKECKRCRIIRQREKNLGVTEDDYKALYIHQKGRCGICGKRLYTKRYKAFCVDHNHETGEIRGLLCHRCNLGLGNFDDDPTRLRRAAEWVEGIVRSPEQSG